MNKILLSLLFVLPSLLSKAQSSVVAFVSTDTSGLHIEIPLFAEFREERGDTIYMSGGPVVNGEEFSITWSGVEGLSVRQCYETSVSVSPGGSHHYDLRNFVHGYTAWQKSTKTDSGYALLPEPLFTGKMPFPSVSQSKLRAAAKNVVNDPVLVGKITTPYVGPCSVNYSAVIIEITGLDSTTKTKRKMFVVVELPMGC